MQFQMGKQRSNSPEEAESPFKINDSVNDGIMGLKHKNTAVTKDSYVHQSTMPEQETSTPKKGRKHEPLPFFIVHLIVAFIISFQNIYIIYGAEKAQSLIGVHLIIADLFFIVCFSVANTLYMVDLKEMFLLYTLFDNILVAEIAAEIGLVGSLLITSGGKLEDHLLMAMVPISFFFFVGNFRVCIRHADWKRYQIIVYKLSILMGAVCFFEIGAYFMAVGYSFTNKANEDLDNKIKDFITLYAFGTFEFFLQIFGKICDFDQTADLKWVYQFKKEDSDDEDSESDLNQSDEEYEQESNINRKGKNNMLEQQNDQQYAAQNDNIFTQQNANIF